MPRWLGLFHPPNRKSSPAGSESVQSAAPEKQRVAYYIKEKNVINQSNGKRAKYMISFSSSRHNLESSWWNKSKAVSRFSCDDVSTFWVVAWFSSDCRWTVLLLHSSRVDAWISFSLPTSASNRASCERTVLTCKDIKRRHLLTTRVRGRFWFQPVTQSCERFTTRRPHWDVHRSQMH